MPGTTDPIWVPTVDAATFPKVLGTTRLPIKINRKPTPAEIDMAVATVVATVVSFVVVFVVPDGSDLRQSRGTE